MPSTKPGLHEEFAKFFENPKREHLRELLERNVGEFAYLDFKEQWPSFPKFSRHLLGIENSGGGCVIVGVAEREDNTLEAAGLETLTDKSDIIRGIENYLPHTLLESIDILDYSFEAAEYPAIVGKKFQVVFVPDDPRHLPFVTKRDGEGIREAAIYVRRGTLTEEANYEELQGVLNRRIETGYSSQGEIDLGTHIEQLKRLYGQLARYHVRDRGLLTQHLASLPKALEKMIGIELEQVPNPMYPEEDFGAFIVRMIQKKKKRIELELDVVELVGQCAKRH